MRVALCRESNPQSKPSSFRFKTGLYVLWLFGVGGGDDPSVSSENSPRATHLCGITQIERATQTILTMGRGGHGTGRKD